MKTPRCEGNDAVYVLTAYNQILNEIFTASKNVSRTSYRHTKEIHILNFDLSFM
jgi:hypothetical protein